jgi:hypothetical protein
MYALFTFDAQNAHYTHCAHAACFGRMRMNPHQRTHVCGHIDLRMRVSLRRVLRCILPLAAWMEGTSASARGLTPL